MTQDRDSIKPNSVDVVIVGLGLDGRHHCKGTLGRPDFRSSHTTRYQSGLPCWPDCWHQLSQPMRRILRLPDAQTAALG